MDFSDGMITHIRVGDVLPEFRVQHEFTLMDYNEPYWTTTVGIPNMKEAELDALMNGDLQVAIAVLGEALFFLFKFGEMPWCDAPFDSRLCPEEYEYEEFAPGLGAPMTFQYIDSASGEVKGLRVVGLGNQISNNLMQACRAIKNIPYDGEKMEQLVGRIYDKYRTSADMLKVVKPANLFMILKKS